MADYPGALDYFVDPERTFIGARPDDVIVIHKTAGFETLEQLRDYFRTNDEEVSSHFGVGLDGRVAQFVPLSAGAAANCCLDGNYDRFWDAYSGFPNKNFCTISIEHIDPRTDNSSELTPAQKSASFKLVKWIMQTKHIPWECVKGHFSLDPVNRARCPGNYPWNELEAYVKGNDVYTLTIQDASSHFHLDPHATGETWVCDNGFIIHGNILKFYKVMGQYGKNGLTDLGLPLSNEISLGKGEAVYQKFERGLVAHDPQRLFDAPSGIPPAQTTYKMHLDQGIAKSVYGFVAAVPDTTKQALSILNTASASIATASATIKKDLAI